MNLKRLAILEALLVPHGITVQPFHSILPTFLKELPILMKHFIRGVKASIWPGHMRSTPLSCTIDSNDENFDVIEVIRLVCPLDVSMSRSRCQVPPAQEGYADYGKIRARVILWPCGYLQDIKKSKVRAHPMMNTERIGCHK